MEKVEINIFLDNVVFLKIVNYLLLPNSDFAGLKTSFSIGLYCELVIQ